MSAESQSETSDRLRPSTSDVSPSSTVRSAGPPAVTPSITQPAPADTSTKTGHLDEQQQQRPSKSSYLVNKQQMAATALHQHYLNYFNSNMSKEETKSHRTRGSISSYLSQHSQQQAFLMNQDHHQHHHQHQHPFTNQRLSSHQHSQNARILNPSSSHIYHIPPTNISSNLNQHHYASPTLSGNLNLSRAFLRDDQLHSPKHPQQQQQNLNQRLHSTGAIPGQTMQQSPMQQRQLIEGPTKISAHNLRQDQLDRSSEETTTIKEELENDLEGYKNSELEAISSLERNLPIELSFLIKQQAHCMAKMNFLDRQIRELRETASHQQQVDMNQVSSTSMQQTRNHSNRPMHNIAATTMTHTKNGNFILSDDSGGEYSRATISDDDELSSLLDQIAKTVRPEQRIINDNLLINSDSQIQNLHHQQQYQQPRLSTAYSPMISNQQQPHQQPYTIINTSQLQQQQAVPIFVMSSPIAVAHPSSINSNILPGVHFQPEPRYNQYYEDFYGVSNVAPSNVTATMSVPTMQRPNLNLSAYRSQNFDSSISAIEQLVNQKEKRQIISQLKSADNWLKMRTANNGSSLFNQQESSLKNVGTKQATMTTSDETQEQVDVASMR